MKKIVNIIAYTIILFLPPLTAYAQFFDHETSCNYEEDLISNGDKKGCQIKHSSGGVHLYFANNDSVKNKLDNIIVIVQGFDPDGSVTPDIFLSQLEDNSGGLISKLTQRDLSIIVISFADKFSGQDIKNNTIALSHAIQFINQQKKSTNKIAIAGLSMGGLVARSALTYMEWSNIDHDARTLLTFDSPHKGAILPLGIQHTLKYFQKVNSAIDKSWWDEVADFMENFVDLVNIATLGSTGKVEEWDNVTDELKRELKNSSAIANQMALMYIDNISSKQMLINYHDPDNNEHDNFYTWLSSIGDYPQNVKKVAFTNGRVDGKRENSTGIRLLQFRNEKDESPKDIYMRVYVYADEIDGKVIDSRATFKDNKLLDDPDEFNFDKFMSSDNYQVADDVPGSTQNPFATLAYATKDNFDTQFQLENSESERNRTFIPTYSALGISQKYAYDNLLAVSNNQLESISPFDKIYYQNAVSQGKKNMRHTYLDTQIGNDIFNELVPPMAWMIPVISLILQ